MALRQRVVNDIGVLSWASKRPFPPAARNELKLVLSLFARPRETRRSTSSRPSKNANLNRLFGQKCTYCWKYSNASLRP
jgi:hypothetical protein